MRITATMIPAMAPTGKLWELWLVVFVIVEPPPLPVEDVEPVVPLDAAIAMISAGWSVKLVCDMEKFLLP